MRVRNERPVRRGVGSGSGRSGASLDSDTVTYIIAEPCIDIKDKSCIDVCPVDCIHEFERILVIDPEECIDCGACEPECPVEAIFPEDALPDKWEAFVKINYAFPDGADVINPLVQAYADEHDVQNPPLE
jgi:ferredoxin